MNKINSNKKVLEFTKNKKMIDLLKESFQSLEIVQKGLNAYLDGKRANFPRFYFLSADELIEIISETKDPLRVQPHLKKCFEGIQKLKFDEEKKIHGMYSSEGEYIAFTNLVDTQSVNGNVDDWLNLVESNMIISTKNVIQKAFEEYLTMKRIDWVLNRCGMAVLCMDMTYWTSEAEISINENGSKGAQEFANTCTKKVIFIKKLLYDFFFI